MNSFWKLLLNMIHTYACLLKKNCLNIIGKGEVKNVINCIKHTVKEISFKNSFKKKGNLYEAKWIKLNSICAFQMVKISEYAFS